MGVAGQPPAAGAGRFMLELKTKREEKGQDKLDKRFGVVKKSTVGGLILEVDGDRAVFPCRFDGLSHVSSPLKSRWVRMRHREDNVLKWQASCERIGVSPLNPLECGYHYLPLQGGAYGERFTLPSPLHAGTAEPLRVSPPEAVAYLLELRREIQ
jgi:hypothetical protein